MVCVPHLRPLGIDGEGRHDKVRPLPDQLPDQPRPLLSENTNRYFNIKWRSSPVCLRL